MWSEGGSRGPQRMIYEDDLRRACLERQIDIVEQHVWVAFRKGLPISAWKDRSPTITIDIKSKAKTLSELKDYCSLFAEEARERNLKLELDRSYYAKAMEIYRLHCAGDGIDNRYQRLLTDLMILVDWKDAMAGIMIMGVYMKRGRLLTCLFF